MFLCEIHPDDEYKWFMGFLLIHMTGMVPNVYGMNQFAERPNVYKTYK